MSRLVGGVVTGNLPNVEPGFVNEPTSAASLPVLDDDAFVSVDPNYLRASFLSVGVVVAVTVVATALIAILTPSRGWIPLAIGAGILAFAATFAAFRLIEVRNMAYQVRTHDLSYRSGVLIKSVATVPFVRVQHARIRQGPLQRRFGISSLEVNSAGPDLLVRGLATDTAERLKVLVIQRAGNLVEDE